MDHKCDRDNCPPTHVDGPKSKCKKCGHEYFLQCFGITKFNEDYVKTKSETGVTLYIPSTMVNIVCPQCEFSLVNIHVTLPSIVNKPTTRGTNSVKTSTINKTTPATGKATIATVSADIFELKELLMAQSEKIDELKNISNKTNNNVTKLSQPKSTEPPTTHKKANTNVTSNATIFKPNEFPIIGTPNSSKPNKARPKFSTVLQTNLNRNGPASAKRKRNEVALIENASSRVVSSAPIPSPVYGTREASIGRPFESKPKQNAMKSNFDKSIWISRFPVDTSPDEISDYIMKNTDLTDPAKFKCTKLVKKDQDLSTLSYVSFKIDVASENFDTLIAASNWPSTKRVREFVKVDAPKRTQPLISPSTLPRAAKAQKIDSTNQTQPLSAEEISQFEEMDAEPIFPMPTRQQSPMMNIPTQ